MRETIYTIKEYDGFTKNDRRIQPRRRAVYARMRSFGTGKEFRGQPSFSFQRTMEER